MTNNIKTNLNVERIIKVDDYTILMSIYKGGDREYVVARLLDDGHISDGHYFMCRNDSDDYNARDKAFKMFSDVTKH